MSLEPLELLVQFVITIIVFLFCTTAFFNKLLLVLQQRESKTTRLATAADKRMTAAEEMAKSYREKIEISYRQAQKTLRDKKEEVVQREDKKYKGQESKISQQIEQERKKITEEIHSKRGVVLGETDHLASSLTKKFIGEN